MAGGSINLQRSRTSSRRAIVGIVSAVLLWEAGSRSGQWLGYSLPWIGIIPAPTSVVVTWGNLIGDASYWMSWLMSIKRVAAGFVTAVALGIPLGLLLALNKTVFRIIFPVFEIVRPIPPLAWVPAAIIFWPTTELAIAFVTFLGAFFTIVINVIGGARAIDDRYFEAARSMGASSWNIFRRITLPGVMPSILVGCVVGLGLTWEVVVAAEMISGGSSSKSGTGGGLGHFIWGSYLGGSYEQIIVGMASIAIAGYVSSAALRRLGAWLTPWIEIR